MRISSLSFLFCFVRVCCCCLFLTPSVLSMPVSCYMLCVCVINVLLRAVCFLPQQFGGKLAFLRHYVSTYIIFCVCVFVTEYSCELVWRENKIVERGREAVSESDCWRERDCKRDRI